MDLCDVTLREGDQMPGRDYAVRDKVEAGCALADLGVEYLQAGFPITGEKDRRAIGTLADETDTTVLGLARAVPGDIDAAIDAEADGVDVFAPLSDRHLEHVVRRSREEMLESIEAALDRAREGGVDAHLSLVDAFRTDPEHLRTAFDRFPEATTIVLADTVGATTPASVRSFLSDLDEEVNLERVGVHFHDDVGVATANAQAAYLAGVGRADVSVASLGERAGNPALEEVVAVGDLEHGTTFGVDREQLLPTCEHVLATLDEAVDPRKALLGREVTEHESGIHTAAMLEEPSAFEAFDPARYGGERTLVFGEGTGSGAARILLERAAVEPTDGRVERYLDELTDRGPMDTAEAVDLAEALFSED